MATKNQTKNTTTKKTKFFPMSVLKNGILYQDGRMLYTDTRGNWLYVSEDGETVLMYNNLAELIKDLYKRDSDADFVVTGWDFYPTRFESLIDNAYNYYNARFED